MRRVAVHAPPGLAQARPVRLAALLVVALAAACTSYGDIPRPNFQMSSGNGLCSTNVVLDLDDDVWIDSGCESRTDYDVVGHASPAEAAAVRDAFAKLPRPPDESCLVALQHGPAQVVAFYSSAEDTKWFPCRDADGKPVEPYAVVIAAMDALPR